MTSRALRRWANRARSGGPRKNLVQPPRTSIHTLLVCRDQKVRFDIYYWRTSYLKSRLTIFCADHPPSTLLMVYIHSKHDFFITIAARKLVSLG